MQAEATKKDPFYLAAIIVGVIALISGFYSLSQRGHAERRAAAAIRNAVAQHSEYTGDAEVTRLRHVGETWQVVGIILSLSCLACIAVATIRREPGYYSIPVMLLFASLFICILVA